MQHNQLDRIEDIGYIINNQTRKGDNIRGKKVATRPSWVYAAVAGLITFLALAVLSTGAADSNSSKEQRKVANVKAKTAVTEDLTPERGCRSYAIRTSADDRTLELISEGNRIDIIVSFPAGPDGAPLTRTVIGAARLLRFDAGKRLAVVEVTPAEAEKIAFSEANGEIRLSVCPPGPDASVPGKGATFEDI